jgi:hypothetical protein
MMADDTQTDDEQVPDAPPSTMEELTAITTSEDPEEATMVEDGDDENVISLKLQLEALTQQLSRKGGDEASYEPAARLLLQITNFVCLHPKVPVLDTLYQYILDNIHGVAEPKILLQGNHLLSKPDAQKVGFLMNLFLDLAHRRKVNINSGLILQVLKKPEVINYYNRRMAGIVAHPKG